MIKNLKKKKIGFIIEARCNSSRLPNKILLKLGKKTIIEYLITRIKTLSKKINAKIIVATTRNKEDDEIIRISKKAKVNFFRGSELNVLNRVVKSARKFKLDIIIRITSDCPLIDINIVEQALNIFLNNSVDLVNNTHIRSYPDGMDVDILSKSSLEKALKLAKGNKEFCEHTTLVLKKYNKAFKIINLISPPKLFYPNLGLTLDEKEDYNLIKKIYEYFKIKKIKKFECLDIINLLKLKPEYLKINDDVSRTKYSI